MRLVILDGAMAVGAGLSLDPLWALCDSVDAYERTVPGEAARRIGDAELILVNKTRIDAALLDRCLGLRYIGLFATGYNNIDVDACRDRGVVVSNAPHYSTGAVAQLVFAYLLHFYSMADAHDRRVHAGEWQNCREYAFYDPGLRELAGKTLGIVGFGSIGRQSARLALAFGMRVLVFTRTPRPDWEVQGIRFVPFDQLLRESDAVSLHCPLFPETERIIGEAALAQMKPSALLLNTARGGLVDEAALAAALHEGRLAGAAVDVVSEEPIRADNPLLSAPNCLITPHIGWAARESRARLLAIVVENLRAFLDGRPQNNVAAPIRKSGRG